MPSNIVCAASTSASWSPAGFGIASGIDQRLIPEAQPVPAVCRTPGLQQPSDQGNDMSGDLLPIASDVIRAVIDPTQPAVTERRVGVEAELAAPCRGAV